MMNSTPDSSKYQGIENLKKDEFFKNPRLFAATLKSLLVNYKIDQFKELINIKNQGIYLISIVARDFNDIYIDIVDSACQNPDISFLKELSLIILMIYIG